MYLYHPKKPHHPARGRDPFSRSVDDVFNELWGGGPQTAAHAHGELDSAMFTPHLEVLHKDDKVKITAELPGLEEDDIQIHLDPDLLVLEGEKKFESDEEHDGRKYSERSYGHFRRSVQLPFEVDREKVQAKFKKGVLTIKLKKAETARENTRRIPIST